MSTPLRERPDAPLGTLIFRAGLLPAETIESALEEGVKTGKRLGEILTERGLISEVDLARLLAGQKGLEFVTLREQIVDPSAAGLFTEEQARLFRALPYAFDGELPVVAIADPTDDVLIRNIREALGREDARFVVTARGELAEIAADVYSKPLQSVSGPEPDHEPGPAAAPESAHANGHAPAEAEVVLEPPVAPEPAASAPEPEPVAPEPAAFQVPFGDPIESERLVPAAPQASPEPEPVAAYAPPEPPTHPVSLEPAPGVESISEPPTTYEPPTVPEAAVVPEQLTEPEPSLPDEPTAGPEPLRVPDAPAPPEPVPFQEPVPTGNEPVAAEPVPFPQPTPAPSPDPYPPAATQPIDPEPASDPSPAPVVQHVEAPEPPAGSGPASTPWRMTIRLTNGERVEAGDFPDEASAKQEAKAIMMQIAAADQDDWPFVNGRFLKPDTIVSVDIAEHDGDDG